MTPLIWVNDDGRGQAVRASIDGENRVYYLESARPGVQLKSVKLDGSEPRIHAGFQFADEVAVSPDGNWVAFTESDNGLDPGSPPRCLRLCGRQSRGQW